MCEAGAYGVVESENESKVEIWRETLTERPSAQAREGEILR